MPTFQTTRCGTLDYREEDVLHFPQGLVGLPGMRRWLILDLEDGVPLKWLQSLDRPDFGFPVTSPGYFTDAYHPGMPEEILAELGAGEAGDLAVLVIATVHEGGRRITGNLLAPLVIGIKERVGCQWTAPDDSWPTRQEINYLKFALAVTGDSSENTPRIADAAEWVHPEADDGASTARPETEKPEPVGV